MAYARRMREKAGAEHSLGVTVQPMITREGYEFIVGRSLDPQFGPVLLFGSGGQPASIWTRETKTEADAGPECRTPPPVRF